MAIHSLLLPTAGPQRILFAQASPQLVAQALADARERLVRQFPAVRWTTWRDTLRQLQLDLLLEGNAVTFDWQDLVRRFQGLAASPARRAPDLPTPGAGESDAQLRAYRRQAVQALAELQATPHVVGPLLYALVTQLAQDYAVAAAGVDATVGVGAHPANQPGPPALEPPFQLVGPAEETVDSRAKGKVGPGLAPSEPLRPQANPPGQAPRRQGARRRTFRAIVERHPRPGGKVGFTVRELCVGLRISAASLTEARLNPGHLSVEKVMALAEMMGESPLHVFYDLMTEASAKPRRKRKKHVTPLQRPKKSTLA
jgi:hypothetical protein